MGIGQSAVEALSVSLISDLSHPNYVPTLESLFYVGVYIGEAISGNISTAFRNTNTSWRWAFRSMGITGIVVSALILIFVREPLPGQYVRSREAAEAEDTWESKSQATRIWEAFKFVVSMKSFWLLSLAASARQLGGNIFGYYMPSYLILTYPSTTNLTSVYGIIVGVCGSFAVVAGGIISSYFFDKHKTVPLHLTAWGGLISSLFVLLMIFSNNIGMAQGTSGIAILYSMMVCAYLTAELWLGAFASLLTMLFPAKYKSFGFAIYQRKKFCALENSDSESDNCVGVFSWTNNCRPCSW